MPLQQLDLTKPLYAGGTLAEQQDLAERRSQNAAESQQRLTEGQLNIQKLKIAVSQAQKDQSENDQIKARLAQGGDPNDIYKDLIKINPDKGAKYWHDQLQEAASQRKEAQENLQLQQNQPGPMVSTPQAPVQVAAPQPTNAPIQTNLPAPSETPQMSAPQTQPLAGPLARTIQLPNRWAPAATRPVTIPSGVGGAPLITDVPYLEENNRRIREAEQAKADIETAKQIAVERAKPVTTPKGAITTIPAANGQPGSTIQAPDTIEPTGDFEKVFLPARAQQLGKVYDPKYKAANAMTPTEVNAAVTDWAQRSQSPEAREQAVALRDLNLQLKQAQLGQQPTPEQAQQVAADLVAHRIAPEQTAQLFGGFGASGQNFKRMVYSEAKKLDPNFDFEQASAEYGLVKSPQFQQQIRFLDHVANTLPRLQDAANKLGNTSIKALNSLLTKGQEQFGGTNIKTFLADRDIVANELGRVLAGGGTGSQTSDSRIEQAQKLVSETDSPAQVAATLKEIEPLLASRRSTLTRGTYLANTNTAAAPSSASPKSALQGVSTDELFKRLTQ